MRPSRFRCLDVFGRTPGHSPISSTVAPAATPVRRVARSFGYALDGLATMVRTQPNFLVHLAAACAALALGLVLQLSPVELALIVLTVALVLALECVNTALEAVCDLASPEFHPLVKRAKDVAAAAVLVAALAALAVAVCVFGPHLVGMVK